MEDLENQLQDIFNEGAYDLTDPKHPTFAKRYQDYLKANNSKHSSVALRGFLDNGGRPTAHGKANEEYEDQLDELSTDTLNSYTSKAKVDRENKLINAKNRYDVGDGAGVRKANAAANKRMSGINTAYGKLNKEEYDVELEEGYNPISEMIESVMSGELTESNSLFYDLLGYKVAEKLEEKRLAVAQSIFGEAKDEDDEDEKSDEVGEDEESKHPLVQLKKIASSEDNLPEKYPETTASGEPDKRSARAYADRKASGKSTAGIPKFKHKNGEESEIHPEHAKHLADILSGSALKPETKKQVLDHIHGSKAGLEKVSAVLTGKKPKEKSIYGSDART